MKATAKLIPFCFILLILCACKEKEVVESFSVSSNVSSTTPITVKPVYSCDHTCPSDHGHQHPMECKSHAYCAKLNMDGSFEHGAPKDKGGCSGANWKIYGVTTAIELSNTNMSRALNELKQKVEKEISAEASRKVKANAELSESTEAEKAKVSGGFSDAVKADFRKKWSEECKEQFERESKNVRNQILKCGAGAGGSFGCGEKNEVDLDVKLTIYASFVATGTVTATVDDEGNVSDTKIQWGQFALTFTVGVDANLTGGRQPTKCACAKRTGSSGTPGDGSGGDFFPPFPLFDRPTPGMGDVQTVYVQNPQEIRWSQNVTVLEQTPDSALIYVAGTAAAAGGGYFLFTRDRGSNARPPASTDELLMIKQGDGDQVLYVQRVRRRGSVKLDRARRTPRTVFLIAAPKELTCLNPVANMCRVTLEATA